MCRWLLRWLEAGNCTDFWLGSLHVNRILTCPKLGGERHLEVEEIWRSSGGFRPRRSWKLHASCFPWPLEWHQCKVNPAKSLETKQKNEGKWTLFIWLSFGGFLGMKCYDLRNLWNISRDHLRLAKADFDLERVFGYGLENLQSSFTNQTHWFWKIIRIRRLAHLRNKDPSQPLVFLLAAPPAAHEWVDCLA